jgi:DNA uptake protein ComE-like DNA-binding protein
MLKDFFTYRQKSDRIAALLLILLILVAILLIVVVGNSTDKTDAFADSLSAGYNKNHPFHRSSSAYYAVDGKRAELFPFDPNTADSTQLLRLGLQPWQVRSIYKYRAKGGIYRTPSDFARLYGLTVKQYRELEPYICISADYQPAASLVGNESHQMPRDTLHHSVKIKETEHVSLADADTSLLKRVPGIGSYYARKIVAYGERLGGYVSVNQLDEIEDFPPEAKKYFTLAAPHVIKMNVNKMTVPQLRRHPYMNYFRAKAIWDYRRLHGALHSLQELRLSRDFPPEVIQELEPYVEF